MTALSIFGNSQLDQWNKHYISPGPVGSVGDCLLRVRLKHDCPDAPLRWEKGSGNILNGTNLQDGMKLNIASKGGPAICLENTWEGGRSFKTKVGWIYQDVRTTDRATMPLIGNTPRYNWNNQVATTFKANVIGEKFLPLPGGYKPPPGTMLRGGNYPTSDKNEIINEGGDYGVIMNEKTAATSLKSIFDRDRQPVTDVQMLGRQK